DGLTDIVTTDPSSNSKWLIYKNTGSGWSTSSEVWLDNSNLDTRLYRHYIRLIDVNGDGLPDILRTSENGDYATWTVYKNTGSSFNSTGEVWINNALVGADL